MGSVHDAVPHPDGRGRNFSEMDVHIGACDKAPQFRPGKAHISRGTLAVVASGGRRGSLIDIPHAPAKRAWQNASNSRDDDVQDGNVTSPLARNSCGRRNE
jgi:hypothetical protein